MVYVHCPFCWSFCTYCDFYSEKACPAESWTEEICREALARKEEIAATAAVNTLYFGGGTPSVLPPGVLGRIADACGGRTYDEWTVEVNPDDITPEYAAGLRAIGVNRVSMGVQSLDDGMLRWMARRHDAAAAANAFRILRDAGFGNISVDVIFGINGLSLQMLETTLRELIAWRPEHISAYQLSIEAGSALGRLVREGRYTELSDEDCAAQYALICGMLRTAGYEHYEISNWALPGSRALHNSAYWVRAPYVGLGPGAHSLKRLSQASGDVRSWNSEQLSGWTSAGEELTEREIREEEIMLGLRTADGIKETLLESHPLKGSSGLVPSAVPGNLRIPEESWFVADDIIASLI